MNIPANIAERYVSAVEREAARTAVYSRLAAAQLAYGQAERALADAEYALKNALNAVDDFNDPQL